MKLQAEPVAILLAIVFDVTRQKYLVAGWRFDTLSDWSVVVEVLGPSAWSAARSGGGFVVLVAYREKQQPDVCSQHVSPGSCTSRLSRLSAGNGIRAMARPRWSAAASSRMPSAE